MTVFVVVAAGSLATLQIEVEAIGQGPAGWLVIIGYDFEMAPILRLVADEHVLDLQVEGVSYWSMDVDQGLVEYLEAA